MENVDEGFYNAVKNISTAEEITPEGDICHVLHTFLNDGASVNYQNPKDFKRTALHNASESGNLVVVKWLKDKGANIDAVDTRVQTPLILASVGGHVKVVKYLAECGANLDLQDKFGCTALIRAGLGGHLEVVQVLVEKDADIEAVNYKFMIAITDYDYPIPAYWGRLKVVEFLLKRGSKIEQRDFDGRTALFRAVTMEHKPIIKFLIDSGADVNARKKNSETPLHRAALHGHLFVIHYLIKHGGDVGAKTIDGLTPYEIAKGSSKIQQKQKGKILKLFEEYQEKKMLLDLQELEEQEDLFDIRFGFVTIESCDNFRQLLSNGSFKSYENRIYLAGPCKVGKTTFASVLTGKEIPNTWESTNGLEIIIDRCSIDLKKKKMIPLPMETEFHRNEVHRILLGQPKVTINPQKCTQSEMNWKDLETDIILVPKRPMDPKPVVEEIVYTRKKDGDQLVSPESFHEMSLKMTASKIQKEILHQIKSKTFKMEIVPTDIIDFGGQKAFDMTHQLFIQHRGVIVLMLNGNINLDEQLPEYTMYNIQEHITTKSILHHWVNSILTYCTEGEDGMPDILFVATHRDLVKEDVEARRREIMAELDRQFGILEKRSKLHYEDLFFINTTDKNDHEISRLKDTLVKLAMSQKTWEEELPMAWVPLLLQIDNMRNNGSNIIERDLISRLNIENADLALTANQVDLFLKHQHSSGKIMYYDEPGLQEFIVIRPPALVNILNSFITDERFWPHEHKSVLENMCRTGKIKKSDLLFIWSDKRYKADLPSDDFKNFVIQLLIRLDILIKPRTDEKNVDLKDEYYFVPCMVTKEIDATSFLETNESEEKICLSYKLKLPSVPPTLPFRLIGSMACTWPIKDRGNETCLYYKSAVLNIDANNDLLIVTEQQRILVYLLNKHIISKNTTSIIQEYLTLGLSNILSFYSKSFGNITSPVKSLFQVEVGLACGYTPCLLPIDSARTKSQWSCEKRVERQHLTVFPLYWYFERENFECPSDCKGLQQSELVKTPSDKQLMHFVKNFDIITFKEYVCKLGVSKNTIVNCEYCYRYQPYIMMFMILHQWRKIVFLTMEDLLKGLDNSNLNTCLLCQATRENTSLIDKLSIETRSKLQIEPDKSILLELSTNLGNCPVELGIELGLRIEDIERILYEQKVPNLSEEIYRVLQKWKQALTPTVLKLMLALEFVDKRGLDFLLKHYIGRSLSDL